MDHIYSNTNNEKRKRGTHLNFEDRVTIKVLKQQGFSNRAIAKQLNCSPLTVGYELKRGTADYGGRGRKPSYSAKRGQANYELHRQKCHRKCIYNTYDEFIKWAVRKILKKKWSFDTCVGRAKQLKKQFGKHKIPCTKTLYNMLWRGDLPLTLFEMPEILKRKKRTKIRLPKRNLGKLIDQRPDEANDRKIFGHWEADTVVGKKRKGEAATFTIVERSSGYYISIKIDGKNTNGVEYAMNRLKSYFGNKFSDVFKSITSDNGAEFAKFTSFEKLGTKVYYAHPYSSWERPINERTNREFRKFIPKGRSMNDYSEDEILSISDELNDTPRKRLGYRTPAEVFEEQLDRIYSLSD